MKTPHPLRLLLMVLALGGTGVAVAAAPAAIAASAAASAAVSSAGSTPASTAASTPASTAAPSVAPVAAQGPAAAAAADPSTPSASTPGATDTRSLDERIQDLKKQTVELNRDLFVLEEELLFPANTQVAVFVSVDVGDFFALDSISLKIDNREVSDYLYTPREVAALLRGGVQRLYVGNLKSGDHELVAFFDGKGPNGRDYRRAASIRFEKGLGAKYLELKVTDHKSAQEPEFEIKDWQ